MIRIFDQSLRNLIGEFLTISDLGSVHTDRSRIRREKFMGKYLKWINSGVLRNNYDSIYTS